MDKYQDIEFYYVITACDHARENCPYFPSNAERIHQNFTDPSKVRDSDETIISEFRRVWNEIKVFAKQFFQQHVA